MSSSVRCQNQVSDFTLIMSSSRVSELSFLTILTVVFPIANCCCCSKGCSRGCLTGIFAGLQGNLSWLFLCSSSQWRSQNPACLSFSSLLPCFWLAAEPMLAAASRLLHLQLAGTGQALPWVAVWCASHPTRQCNVSVCHPGLLICKSFNAGKL